jgi:hypothetical protein
MISQMSTQIGRKLAYAVIGHRPTTAGISIRTQTIPWPRYGRPTPTVTTVARMGTVLLLWPTSTTRA